MPPDIINGLFGLGGVIIGGLIGYFTARHVAIVKARIDAIAKLRVAFAPEIAQMRLYASGEKIDVNHLLLSAFPRHATAIEEFSPYLCKEQKKKYYKAWKEYYETGGGIRFERYYMGQDPKENFNLFEKNIHAILQFAEK